jgi:FKBP-type peptidyl-prolyl cis-trans isomerase
MLRTLLVSALLLVGLYFIWQGSDVSPQRAQDRILLAGLNAEEGAAFRTANRQRAGVVELQHGLQVEMLEAGEGAIPSAHDWVVLHYRGEHIDGRVFDDSRRRGEPSVLPIERSIEGWRRVLPSTPTGSRLRLVVPPSLAYGAEGGGPIGPEETLVFEIELLSIAAPPTEIERDPSQMAVPGLR